MAQLRISKEGVTWKNDKLNLQRWLQVQGEYFTYYLVRMSSKFQDYFEYNFTIASSQTMPICFRGQEAETCFQSKGYIRLKKKQNLRRRTAQCVNILA